MACLNTQESDYIIENCFYVELIMPFHNNFRLSTLHTTCPSARFSQTEFQSTLLMVFLV